MLEEVIMKKHSLFKVILIVFGALVLINGGLAIAGQFVEKLNVFKMIPIGDTLINFTQSITSLILLFIY